MPQSGRGEEKRTDFHGSQMKLRHDELLCMVYLLSRRPPMEKTLTRFVIALLLFATMAIFPARASSTQVTIIYGNDINGQIDPLG